MKFLPQRTFFSVIVIVSLVVILVALAVLQYDWSGQVSKAEHERMHTSLQASTNQFRLHFNSEFRQLAILLQPEAAILKHKDWDSFAANCDAVLNRSGRRLIRNIYVWAVGGDSSFQLLKLNRGTKSFEAAPWPSGFEAVRERYAYLYSGPFQPGPEIRPFSRVMFYQIPLMLQPLLIFQPSSLRGAGVSFAGCLLMELDSEAIRTELFPELAKKYFEGPNGFVYQVAVATRGNPDILLYQSDPHLTIASFAKPDAKISLFENQHERFSPAGPRPGLGPQPMDQSNSGPPEFRYRPEPPAPEERSGRGPILYEDKGPGWELVAKHSMGSLEIAVAANRMRNLALSLGSLMLLAMSMALIIVSARRAQRLARLQIDFVAGISHELRTPLSVICSAGDNLAEGVTEDSSRSTRKYGELIRSEGRKLAGMIEQILQFASLQRIRHRFNLRPESVNEIADAALKLAQPTIADAGFSVEKSLAQNLPRIYADAAVLTQLIQNLIQNALKYSGESRWLAIRTVQSLAKRQVEVQLIVEDRGMGIDSADLPHVFEPFYRGSQVTDAQIHGTGLGLFMVREALVLMGGRISVKSALGKGSSVALHFPALPASEDSRLSTVNNEEHANHAIQNTID
jgi:signal transduction histidine kinase